MTDSPSTLPNSSYFRENFPLAVLFGSNGNSQTISTSSDIYIYIYIYIYFKIQEAGRVKNKKILKKNKCCMQKIIFLEPLSWEPWSRIKLLDAPSPHHTVPSYGY